MSVIQSRARFARSGHSDNVEFARLEQTLFSQTDLLSPEERRVLEEALGSTETMPAHSDFARSGDVLVLLEGWACSYDITKDGQRQMLSLHLPGDICNVSRLVSDAPGSAIGFLRESRVATLSHTRLSDLSKRHPGVAQTFLWLATRENVILQKWVFNLGTMSAEQHLAHLICETCFRLGVVRNGKVDEFEIPLTQAQLAEALGMTVIHTNRTMKLLNEKGLVQPSRKMLFILDFPGLCKIAEFDDAYLRGVGYDGEPNSAVPVRSSSAA